MDRFPWDNYQENTIINENLMDLSTVDMSVMDFSKVDLFHANG